MDEYVKKIIEVCTEAEPAQKMTFDNFASYVLCVEKDETNKVNISIYEKNAIIYITNEKLLVMFYLYLF